MTALAAEYGGTPAAVELDAEAPVSLLELARDNAVQGCVGETWAALIARHQADAGETVHIREVMRTIAADETEHAELAWAIDAWVQPRLSAEQRREVAAARDAACEALGRGLATGAEHPARRVAGVPRRATALALHAGLRRALWAAPENCV